MPPAEPYLLFTRELERLGLRYMVTGSIAAIYYGEPRLTNDVDIVLVLDQGDASRLNAAFPLDDFYCPPVEVIEVERLRKSRGHFNLIHHQTGFKADIYLGSSDLHEWGLKSVKQIEMEADLISIAPPEYVIVRKLQFYREGGSEKHLRDIERMLVGLGEEWGRGELIDTLNSLGLEEEWSKVLARDP